MKWNHKHHDAIVGSLIVPAGSRQIGAEVDCKARRKEFCQYVAFRTPAGRQVLVITNDEITVGPIAGSGIGMVATPWLAKGQGSFTLGAKTLSWSVAVPCASNANNSMSVNGTLPWKSIQTVILPEC